MNMPGHRSTRARLDLALAAGWEVAGLSLLILLGGMVLLTALLVNLRVQEEDALRRAQVMLTLGEVQAGAEADLALGFELHDSQRLQPLMEKSLQADREVFAIDLIDRRGITLFSTDRGAVGSSVPDAVRDAAEQGARDDRSWRAVRGSEQWVGLPVHGAFGDVVGHVSIGYPAVRSEWDVRALIANPLLQSCLGLLLLLLLLFVPATRWVLRPQQQWLERQQAGVELALQRSDQTRARLQDCLQRLDEGEQQE